MENTCSRMDVDSHDTATRFVDYILDKVFDTVFGKIDSFQYTQEKCKNKVPLKSFSNNEGMQLCLKSANELQACSELDGFYPVGLTSSSLRPPLDDISDLVNEQLPTNIQQSSSPKMGMDKINYFDSLEKYIVLNNVQSNKASESMALSVCLSTEKYRRRNELDFTILSGILSDLDSIPSYLLNKMSFENVTENNRKLLIFSPKSDHEAGASLLRQRNISVQNNFCQTLKGDVQNANISHPIITLETEQTSKSYVSRTGTSSVFASSSSKTIPLLGNKVDDLHLQSDQTVPRVFISESVQNLLEKRRDDSIRTVTEKISSQRVWSVQYNKWNSASKTSTSLDQLERMNDKPTNDSHKIMSLNSMQILTAKSTKTIIEHSFEICNRNDIVPHKSQMNKITPQAQDIENSTMVGVTEMKAINSISTECDPIVMSRSIIVPSNADVNVDKEPLKQSSTCNGDSLKLFYSSWRDDDHDMESCAETDLDRVEERDSTGKPEQPLLNSESDFKSDVDSDENDVDELDRIIDDSIRKYETFTIDASVLATPTTAEKSCQTEMFDTKSVERCKRCLEFEDQPTVPMKKMKLNPNNECDNRHDVMCHALDNSSAPSIIQNQIHSYNEMPTNTAGPTQQQSPFRFADNFEDLLAASPSGRFSDCLRSDETHDLDYEGSLFDEESVNGESNQMDNSNESSCNSDQEVPGNPQASEGLPPSCSFVTPKKPILRVGLSRSARFKPLHPKI